MFGSSLVFVSALGPADSAAKERLGETARFERTGAGILAEVGAAAGVTAPAMGAELSFAGSACDLDCKDIYVNSNINRLRHLRRIKMFCLIVLRSEKNVNETFLTFKIDFGFAIRPELAPRPDFW